MHAGPGTRVLLDHLVCFDSSAGSSGAARHPETRVRAREYESLCRPVQTVSRAANSLVAARDSVAVSGAALELASAAPWAQAAFRSAKQHGPNRVPFGLKMTRFLFGYWPAGEPDPWHTADFLPALFGYTELTRSRLVACPRAEWTSNRHLDRHPRFPSPRLSAFPARRVRRNGTGRSGAHSGACLT